MIKIPKDIYQSVWQHRLAGWRKTGDGVREGSGHGQAPHLL